MSFAITKRVLYSTGITHSLKSNFTSASSVNLIVSKSPLLQIYMLRDDESAGSATVSTKKLSLLSLVYETYLFGNVRAMNVIRLPGHVTDALILYFDDWMVSMVEWDVSKHDLYIISLHNFDKNLFLKEGPSQFVLPARIEVDYKGRCACVLICDEYLAIIPFIDTRHGSNTSKVPEEKYLRRKSQSQSSFVVKLPDYGIRNVKDVKFLHGYYEPALMILYEPVSTWVGRLTVLSQSMFIAILTLDLARQQSMVVWSVSNLPHDCYAVCPLIHPGGACILSSSAILYIDHSSRYKLVLNKFGLENSADFNGKFIVEESELVLSLDNACYTFLNDHVLLLGDENSDYFVLQLVCDSRTVIKMILLHAFRAVCPHSLVALSPSLVFIVSRIADSLLISFKSKTLDADDSNVISNHDSSNDDSFFKQNEEFFADDPDVMPLISLMKSSKFTTERLHFLWKFKIVESLPSLAPLVDFAIREITGSPDRALEFLTVSGHDVNGAITLIRDGSRNTQTLFQHITADDVEAIWALPAPTINNSKKRLANSNRHASVRQKKSSSNQTPGIKHADQIDSCNFHNNESTGHKYLLITTKEDSIILEYDDGSLIRRDVSDQILQVTIDAGYMLSKYNILVHDYDVVSCEGFSIIDQYQVEEPEVYITWSDMREPYIVLMLSNERVKLLRVDETGRLDVELDLAVSLSSVALFRDGSSMLGFNQVKESVTIKGEELKAEVDDWSCLEDEQDLERATDPVELMIYGFKSTTPAKQNQHFENAGSSAHCNAADLVRPYYLLFVLKDGTFEIHKICETSHSSQEGVSNSYVYVGGRVGLVCVFRTFGLNNGRSRLEYDESKKSYFEFNEELPPNHTLPNVLEIKMQHCGSSQKLPFLIACLDNGNIYVYFSYYYADPLAPDQILPIRFVRIQLPVICTNLHEITTQDAPKHFQLVSRQTREWDHARIHYFANISGKEGFFITGEMPLWIFCERDALRFQRMRGEGYVFAWSQIDFPTCRNGYIFRSKAPNLIMSSGYINSEKSILKFCNFDVSYECDVSNGACSFRRIPLRETPHSVTYDPKSGSTLVLVSKRFVNWKRYAIGGFDDTKEAQRQIEEETGVYDKMLSEMDPRLPPVYEERCGIRIFDADWNEGERFALMQEEWGICKFLMLNYYFDHGNKVQTNFLVLGTSLARGEDAICKGRIFVFDLYKNRLLLKCAKGRKNPIAVIEAINGSLITSEGRQIYLYQVRANEGLYPIAFFDAQLATISLTVFKNYVFFGDIQKSCHFLRWIDSIKSLQLLGKDCNCLKVISTSVILLHNRLALVLVDDKGNLYLFEFDPKNPKSIDGSRLICLGDLYYGTAVRKMEKYAARTVNNKPSKPLDKTTQSVVSQNGVTENESSTTIGSYIAGLDGSFGYLYPISKDVFNILRKVEARLADQLEYPTGLHPYATRLTRPRYKLNHSHTRVVLDGELLWKFVHLEYTKQEQLALSVGLRSSLEILEYLIQFHVYSGFIL